MKHIVKQVVAKKVCKVDDVNLSVTRDQKGSVAGFTAHFLQGKCR